MNRHRSALLIANNIPLTAKRKTYSPCYSPSYGLQSYSTSLTALSSVSSIPEITLGGPGLNPPMGLDQDLVVLMNHTEGTSSQEVMMTLLHPTRTTERETNHPPARTGGLVSGAVLRWVALRPTYSTAINPSRRHRIPLLIELRLMIGNATGHSRFLSSLVHYDERRRPGLHGMTMTEEKARRILAL